MSTLEDQIQYLADAAFEASEPIAIPTTAIQTSGRRGLMAVAAALVIIVLGAAVVWPANHGNHLVTTVDGSLGRLEITDPLNIDLSEAVAASSQQRIQRLGAVTIVDIEALAEIVTVERHFLIAGSGELTPYGYSQQISVQTPERARLVINVSGPTGTLMDSDESYQEAVAVRGSPGVESQSQLTWLENGEMEVTISGSSAPGLPVDPNERQNLAESLRFTDSATGWTDGDELHLEPTIDGDPILAGTVAGITWNVIENDGELVVRTGDLDLVTLTHPLNSNSRWSYSYGALAIPGGALFVGQAPPGVDQVEMTLEGGAKVVIPAVELDDGLSAFVIPIDDQLDPLEMRMVTDGVASNDIIHLGLYPPYLGGAGYTSG